MKLHEVLRILRAFARGELTAAERELLEQASVLVSETLRGLSLYVVYNANIREDLCQQVLLVLLEKTDLPDIVTQHTPAATSYLRQALRHLSINDNTRQRRLHYESEEQDGDTPFTATAVPDPSLEPSSSNPEEEASLQEGRELFWPLLEDFVAFAESNKRSDGRLAFAQSLQQMIMLSSEQTTMSELIEETGTSAQNLNAQHSRARSHLLEQLPCFIEHRKKIGQALGTEEEMLLQSICPWLRQRQESSE